MMLGLMLLVGELAARAYWRISERVPPLRTDKLIDRFHRDVSQSGVVDAVLDRCGPTIDVLLLGGSVLHADFGCIERLLRQRIESALSRPARVFNLSAVGRTSRDSLEKYARLNDKRFHLVVVYDGINDVRLNNCPPTRFRDDYTHCSWYLWIERLKRHTEVGWWAMPYTLEYWAIDAIDSFNVGVFVPRHRPRDAWLEAGSNVRTDRTLAANLTSMLAIAKERGDIMAVCTFAWHLSKDYSEAAFRARQLDYDKHSMPVEMWGLPANVAKALRLQNAAIRQTVAMYPDALLIDQEQAIEGSAANFDDICHLTDAGCKRFVDNLMTGWMTAIHKPLASSHESNVR